MRRWWVVSVISVSAFVAPIVTAAPAHAVCISLFQRCPAPGPTPTTVPPAPPITSPPAPTVAPPPPTPAPAAAAIDPNQAATEFFDDTNAARADAGLPRLTWRADAATLAVAHSVEMAQQGSIWHGNFVTAATLHSLGASALGENVAMGQAVAQIHDAFMNSPHHRDNILDSAFNQVGIGVIVSGDTLFVTEDFVQGKAGSASARPTPVAHPVVKKPVAASRTTNSVASAPKQTVPTTTTLPTTAASAPAVPAPEGVVTAAPLDPAPVQAAAAPADVAPRTPVNHGAVARWTALLGVVLLAGTAGGHLAVRRRRQA
jgi:uncharacterized protein YkwD